MTRLIDLDANATTRLQPTVRNAILEALDHNWGNPSSDTGLGTKAMRAIEDARTMVAALISATPEEIIFTSGATEAINLGIIGTVSALGGSRVHIVITAVEHTAVLRAIEYLYQCGVIEVTALAPDVYGQVSAEQVAEALRPDTALVCVIHGNNEIGSVNPIDQIGRVIRNHPARFFVDASQTLGYLPPSVQDNYIDLLVMSGHKMHGPKGVGALYVRHGLSLNPIMFGGGQERGYRPGTINTPLVVGFGVACKLATEEAPDRAERVRRLRDRLLARLQEAHPDIKLNGHPSIRLPSNLSLTIPYVRSYFLQDRLPHLAFSRGSACTSGSGEPSHVLKGIGLGEPELYWTIRIGLSCMNTRDEIEQAAKDVNSAISALRAY